MRKATFQITAECQCISIPAFRADNKSYIPTFMFQGFHETYQKESLIFLFSTIFILMHGNFNLVGAIHELSLHANRKIRRRPNFKGM